MKKTFMNPEMEELEINETANGMTPDEDFDGEWQQIGDKWYRPGNGSLSDAE